MWSKQQLSLWLIFFNLFLNILHIYQISDEYFKYDVSTDVQLIIPETTEKPTVTLCFKLDMVIKWDKLEPSDWIRLSLPRDYEDGIRNRTNDPKKLRNLIVKGSAVIHKHLDRLMRVKEMMNMTLSFQDIVNQVETIQRVKTVSGSYNFEGYRPFIWMAHYPQTWNRVPLKIESFFMNQQKCYRIRCNTKERFVNFQEIHDQYEDGLLQTIRILPNFLLEEVKIFISDNYHELTHGSHNSEIVSLTSRSSNNVRLSYDSYESQLLKHPFKTDCVQYPKSMTRKECYQNCLKKKAIEKFGIIPLTCNAYENETSKIYGLFCLDKECWSFQEFMVHVQSHCGRSCVKRECSSIILVPRLESKASNDKVDDYAIIALHSSKIPVVRAVSQPAIPVVTFLTNVFSTFGFWLGISVLGFMKKAKHGTFFEHLFKKTNERIAKNLQIKKPKKFFVSIVHKVSPEPSLDEENNENITL